MKSMKTYIETLRRSGVTSSDIDNAIATYTMGAVPDGVLSEFSEDELRTIMTEWD